MAGENNGGRSESVVPRQVGISYGDGGVAAPAYRGGFALAGGGGQYASGDGRPLTIAFRRDARPGDVHVLLIG
jgi:hypothetical protein